MSTLSQPGDSQIETVVVPRSSDLGGFEVRRALPSAQRRTVGPFVFLDHMGPVGSPRARALTCARIRTSACPP